MTACRRRHRSSQRVGTAASGLPGSVRHYAAVMCSRDALGCTWSSRTCRPPGHQLAKLQPSVPSLRPRGNSLQFPRKTGGSLAMVSQSGPAEQLARQCLDVASVSGHPASGLRLRPTEKTHLLQHTRAKATSRHRNKRRVRGRQCRRTGRLRSRLRTGNGFKSVWTPFASDGSALDIRST